MRAAPAWVPPEDEGLGGRYVFQPGDELFRQGPKRRQALPLRVGGSSEPFVGPVDLRAELARVQEFGRAIDYANDIRPVLVDVESIHEEAIERAAIVAECSGSGGLVSVPTTGKRSADQVRARSDELQSSLRAFRIEREAGRIARMRRAVGFAARAHGAATRPGHRPDYCAMITLTYADGDQWRPDHLKLCLQHVRKWLQRNGYPCRYVWVAELQQRGAIHYHVALWLPPGVKVPKPDQAGWWPHGHTRIEAARGAVQYLMKYLSKGGVARLPQHARMHGAGGLDHAIRRAKRWLGLPAFIQARADIHDDWKRATGGGWWSPDGVQVPSEFARAYVGDAWCCVQVANYGRPFEASGPFSWVSRRPEAC